MGINNIKIRKLIYHLRHRYVTLNNIVIAVAFLIAAGWAWGAVGVMQKNYTLQKLLTTKQQQEQVAELDNETLQLQQKYYQSPEYLEIEAKRRLGLADPGERVLILPPNSQEAMNQDHAPQTVARPVAPSSNFAQWINFLFGSHNSPSS